MADNQMVKIVFDFDLGNVPASAKKLSQYLKDNNLDLKFTKASVDGLSASLNQLSTEQTKAGAAAAAAGNQIKKSNQQWTNFALILQDLPYGFRGIQNNIPAVIGSFAGMTGPIYLVGSAIIAFFTAWDNGMIKFGDTVKLTTNFSKEAATAYSNETIQLESLYRVTTDANVSMDERLIAAQALKKEYPGLLGLYSDEDIALGKADESYKKLTTTIWQYAQVKAAEKTLEELAIRQNDLTIKKNKTLATQKERELYLYKEVKGLVQDEMTFTQRLVKTFNDLPKGPLMMVNAWQGVAKSTEILTDIEKEQQSINEETKVYKDIIDANITSVKKLNGYTQDPKKTSVGRLDDPNIKLLEAKKQYYKDDLLMSASFEQEILGKQRDLAVKQAELEKKSGTYIQTIKDTYNQLILNSQAETGKKIIEEQSKLGLEQAKEYDKAAKEKERRDKEASDAANKINDRDLQNSLTALKIESDVATKIANASGKTTSTDRIKILEDYKSKLYELASTGGYTAEQFDKIADALINVDAAIAGSKDKVKSFNVTWTDTINGINSTINDFINNSLYALGESIGKVLAGENVDAIDVFGTLIADALQSLGKQLIAFGVAKLAAWEALKNPTPAGAALAIAAGIAAVAAGAALKSTLTNAKSTEGGFSRGKNSNMPRKFADGGIISGPTYGLMGEYPGAKSNPEVVAPLDKLKDMIGGGGGGTFMLRGQDLLLSVNRAQKASNLKGQNISLV
jgi:hypothetical protein